MSADLTQTEALALAGGLVLSTVETESMDTTAAVIIGMTPAEVRRLAVALVRMSAAMVEAEAEAWAERDDDGEALPPATRVVALFAKATR